VKYSMKEKVSFYNIKPEEITGLYPEITRTYQQAFAGEPWFEVSKCADSDKPKRCTGGFSPLCIGDFCQVCQSLINIPAYEKEELIRKFEYLAATRPTRWYVEKNDKEEITLAAVAWTTTKSKLFKERYADVPKMREWLNDRLMYEEQFVWLDDIFADKVKSPSGNLANFYDMCRDFTQELNQDIIAFRTINPRIISAVKRDFPPSQYYSEIFEANDSDLNRRDFVPDRRNFIIIKRFSKKGGGCGR